MTRPLAVLAVLAAVARARRSRRGAAARHLPLAAAAVLQRGDREPHPAWGAIYTVDGYDDQCGAAQRAPLVGLATPNPDGTIGFGLHVVTVPGGRGVHIDARITLPSGSGSWTDSAGNSGTFAFGATTGGSPRPAPPAPARRDHSHHLRAAARRRVPGAWHVRHRGDSGVEHRHADDVASRGRRRSGPARSPFPAWDDVNIGTHSTAFGLNTVASRTATASPAGVDSAAHRNRQHGVRPNAQANGELQHGIRRDHASGSEFLAGRGRCDKR